ncbi:MAG: guanylate kinase [Candidatus Cloacimonetes bacterium]|nr:guanylate kinase [Candidatus Cloacimonadota bacterium]
MVKYKKKNFLIILIAPSGGGKSTIGKIIHSANEKIEYSISYTTRKARGTEVNGRDYFFVSEDEFKKRADEGDFIEYAYVHGNWYGTSKSFIQDRIINGNHILLDIDVQGAMKIIGSGINSITVFILPPNEKILKQRLVDRGTDSPEIISARLKNAKAEIKEIRNFQYLVINDNLNKAIAEVENIIRVEENKVSRYEKIYSTFYEENTC